jgi:DNA-binding MarR family transcriptional regulator
MIKEKSDELADLPDASWFFRLTRKRFLEDWKDLNPTQRTILLDLWLYAGKKKDCFPSERKIAADLGITLKTIWENIKKLEKKKFIRIEIKISQRGKYHHYFLLK